MISPNTEAARIARIRLHRRNPKIVRALKAQVSKLILRGYQSKHIALEVGISPISACRWLHVLGFKLMYVTAEERAHLLQRRRISARRKVGEAR